LTVEFFPDESVDCHFRHTASEQPRNRSAPLVNFALTAFAVGDALAGADGWRFGGRHGENVLPSISR
jgi:hypothetical protein